MKPRLGKEKRKHLIAKQILITGVFLDEKGDVFCLHGLFHCSDPPQFGDKTKAFSICSLESETSFREQILVDAIFERQLFDLLLTLFIAPLFVKSKISR